MRLNPAKLYDMLSFHENPISLVEVRGISKRSRKPVVLTVEQFWLVFGLLKEPDNIMVLVAQCTGLRVCEVLGLAASIRLSLNGGDGRLQLIWG